MGKPHVLDVYQRGAARWVVPSARSPVGFEAVDVVVPVADPPGLAVALAEAERRMNDELAKPEKERRFGIDALLAAAGCPDWATFARGAVAASLRRTGKGDTIELMMPRNGGPEMGSVGEPRALPKGTDLATLAALADEVLASAPRPRARR